MTLLTSDVLRFEMYRIIFVVFLLQSIEINGISLKYRRWCSPWKFCSLTQWKNWSECDKTCGGGVRTRYRQMCSLPIIDFAQHMAMCNRTLNDLIQRENCSQICSSYGVWSNETFECVCEDLTIVDSCCTTDRGRWSQWSDWSTCSARCGTYGVRNRTRICLWKNDLIKRDVKNNNCQGERIQFESCLNDCSEPEFDEKFFHQLPENVTTHIGKHAQFICKQKSGEIRWLINDRHVESVSIENPSIKFGKNSSTLFIYPITNFFSRQTRITCRNSFSTGEQIHRHAWLIIDDNNNDDDQCALIKPIESIYYVRFGSTFSIQCQPKSPTATILWQKNFVSINDETIQIFDNSMLFIERIDSIHHGNFSCTVRTSANCQQISSWTLNVFSRTEEISTNFPSIRWNFVGTHGVVLAGSAPWHVTISYRDGSTNFHLEAFCSGLLIDEETIVSVSQCFDDKSTLQTYLHQQHFQFDPKNLVVFVGKYDRLISSQFERQSSVVRQMKSNEEFVIFKVHLLFLTSESRPLPLATTNELNFLTENSTLFATGWGPLSSNADQPMRLKYVQQRFIDCNSSTSSPQHLCTTSIADKQANLCPGDTGGVLFAQIREKIFAIGLISRFSRIFCDFRSKQISTILRLDTIQIWLKQNSLT